MSESKPLVSVVLPIYNVEKYLPKCLDSVVGQSYENIEIICVNDGSPDNSIAVLESYAEKDSRIIIINQENTGLSGARNTGIEAATGDYIIFLDSDDWMDAEAVETAMQYAEKADTVMWGYIREFHDKSLEKKIFDGDRSFDEKETRNLHRRLAGLAGEELRLNNLKVIDVALKYGYEIPRIRMPLLRHGVSFTRQVL